METAVSPTIRPDRFTVHTESWSGHGWRVYTKKGPISSSTEIDTYSDKLGIPLPEMMFGSNEVGIEHRSGWSMKFNTLSALDLVDKTGQKDGGLLQVAHSKEWIKSRTKHNDRASQEGVQESDIPNADVNEIFRPFDWTYTTSYNGDETSTTQSLKADKNALIPLDKLKRPDPILFFDDVTLYEDELGDNGIVLLNVKIRVMSERLLLLCRLYLRVDNVIFRVRDTRVFVEFNDDNQGHCKVIREYTVQQAPYSAVRSKILLGVQDFGQYLRDPNWVSKQIPSTSVELESLVLK